MKKSEYNQRWKKKYPWVKHLLAAKWRCLDPNNKKYYQKGIKFFLNMKEIKWLWHGDRAWLLKTPSLDRVDSKGDYTIENCRFIEHKENSAQGNRTHSRKVAQYTLEGKLMRIYASLADATRAVGQYKNSHSSHHITDVCKGKTYKGKTRRTAWGYKWQYV